MIVLSTETTVEFNNFNATGRKEKNAVVLG